MLGPDENGPLPWERYRRLLCRTPETGLSVDVSRMGFDEDYLAEMSGAMASALDAMAAIDRGAVANLDENRMVGHYWLRRPELAPSRELTEDILTTNQSVVAFADDVRTGRVRGAGGGFLDVIHVGIGGSAAGPQLLHGIACGRPNELGVHFLDNVDPDGLQLTLGRLRGGLGRTLVSVVSKSGHTPTPLLVAQEIEALYRRAGRSFAEHAVATTMPESDLGKRARAEGWLRVFPLWDWVGGRTSVMSAVGLLPAALAGFDIRGLLDGAAAMDERNRSRGPMADNPAALLALSWFWAQTGGRKSMVVLPYRDRLSLLPRYIQQLVMESIGKRLDRRGRVVQQGLTVYGHKGSTDQHAYLQQLKDGPADFFAVFVGARADPGDSPILGDHLFANLEGTRDALYARGRGSITIMMRALDARCVGALIAVFERATGLYAELLDVNAYHQPAVDKYTASGVIELQLTVLDHLRTAGAATAAQIADAIGQPERVETVFKILENLAATEGRGVEQTGHHDPSESRFRLRGDEWR